MHLDRVLPPHNTPPGRIARASCCIVALDLFLLVLDYLLLGIGVALALPPLMVEIGGYLARVIALPVVLDCILVEIYGYVQPWHRTKEARRQD